MKTFKVYFDYEEEDAVEVEALNSHVAIETVMGKLIAQGLFGDDDRDNLFDSLNAKVIG